MASPRDQPILPQLFDGVSPQEHATRWLKCWEDKFTPWDRGGPSLALYDLLKENLDGLIPLPSASSAKTALVPGCGRGYDVLLLSSLGYDVYGLDVSSQALDAARNNAEKALADGLYNAEEEGAKQGAITWICQDFFAEDWKDVPTPFDLIFDYTVRIKTVLLMHSCFSRFSLVLETER